MSNQKQQRIDRERKAYRNINKGDYTMWWVIAVLAAACFLAFVVNDARADKDEPEFTNQDILVPWNDPVQKDDVLTPWNDSLLKDDINALWNDIVADKDSTNEYLRKNDVNDTDYYYNYEDPDNG